MARKEILVVEDQEELRKLECILLSSRGYKVDGVADGYTALSFIASNKPDLVLLDVMLPDIDGFEICRQIKGNMETSHIQVIMLTAKNSREDLLMGEQVGADGYITKPFRSAVIVETIRKKLSPPLSPAFTTP